MGRIIPFLLWVKKKTCSKHFQTTNPVIPFLALHPHPRGEALPRYSKPLSLAKDFTSNERSEKTEPVGNVMLG
jgi:hypothetical protein